MDDGSGNFTVKAHTHEYSYTAANGVMTQKCTTECRHSATATLVLDENADLTYTGSAITPYSVTHSDTWAGEKLTVAYENNVDAGEATAKLVVGEVIASVTFTIAQATPEYTAPTGLTAQIGQTLADVKLPENWSWVDSTTAISEYGTQSYKATYTPTDKNYASVTVDVTLSVMLRGDVDLDKDVDAYDLTLLAQHVGGVVELTDPTALKNADVDLDDDIDAYDLTRHACFVGGVIVDWDEPIQGGNEA